MRLFAGITLDERTRAACAEVSARLEGMGFGARYEEPEKYHITLAFLGNVETQTQPIDAIAFAIDEIAATTPAFTVTLDKLGAFPHERRARIIFVGSRTQGLPFRNLATALRERYEALGFAFTDDSVVHVTIARVKGGSVKPLPLLEVAPTDVSVSSITLFESLPAERTTRYVIRHTAPLRSSSRSGGC